MINNAKRDYTDLNRQVKEKIEEIYRPENGFTVTIYEVVKNNDSMVTGIEIKEKDDLLAPIIYLDGLYENHFINPNEFSILRIVSEIVNVFENRTNPISNFKVESIESIENYENKIYFKIANFEKNKEFLKDRPFIRFCDLCIIFNILIHETHDTIGSVPVNNHVLNKWGVTVENLYELAKMNTEKLFPAYIKGLSTVISELSPIDLSMEEIPQLPVYVLTNMRNIEGASALLYNSTLDILENSEQEYYIIPSSIHEVLLAVKIDEIDVTALKEMVVEVNSTEVSAEEFLSNNVYYYDKTAKEIKIAI